MPYSFRDRPRQVQALGNGGVGWRVAAVNGGVGGGCQRATADADKALST
jgi:hypothetical protein